MKRKSIISIMSGVLLISIFTLSNGMAEEIKWLNLQNFIGGQNVQVSHGSPIYPGSIIVDVLPTEVPVDEPVIPAEASVAEIIQRIDVMKNMALTSVIVCFREAETTQPFGVNIYGFGMPTDAMTVEADELFGSSELNAPVAECTVIPIEEGIVPDDENLMLGVVFDLEGITDTTAGIVSAVGLGLTSTMLEIDGCDTGLPDIDVDGRPLSELVDECAASARNHGKFVSCVNKIANALKKEGTISGREKGNITKCAARSDLP